jgi:prepilin-type N-terminal cleavage/methylation domain-containing protein
MYRGTLTHDRAFDWQTRSGSKSGFTLVELLVVLVIIGMLASMVSFAMFRSMQAAREAKTQALISKLHNVIVRHWDTFETGQIPFTSSVSDPTDAQRLLAVREWMQFEMPNSTGDLTGSPTLINKPLTNTVINDMGGISGNAPTDAQCLYRLATLLADDDLDRINLFSENETKDINGDGTPDIFIDGWGQPIRFIRWPAGLVTDIQDCNSTTSPDPFDPTGIGSGYALFPLIYSHGSDKKGLEPSTTGGSDPFVNTYTATSDDNDNIHNHRLNARLQ